MPHISDTIPAILAALVLSVAMFNPVPDSPSAAASLGAAQLA